MVARSASVRATSLRDFLNLPMTRPLRSAAVAVGKAIPTDLDSARVALRNKGNAAAAYSVDYWLDPDAGLVTVGTARLLQIPRADAGTSASEPHCRFEGLTFDVVE